MAACWLSIPDVSTWNSEGLSSDSAVVKQIILLLITENSKWVPRIKWRDILNSSREQEVEMAFMTAINKQWLGEYFSFFSFLPPAQGIGSMSSTTSVGPLMCNEAPAAREGRASFIDIVFTKIVGSTWGCLAAKFAGNWPTISQAFGRGLDRRAQQDCSKLISLKSAQEQLSSTRGTEMKFAKQLKELKAVWYLHSVRGH